MGLQEFYELSYFLLMELFQDAPVENTQEVMKTSEKSDKTFARQTLDKLRIAYDITLSTSSFL